MEYSNTTHSLNKDIWNIVISYLDFGRDLANLSSTCSQLYQFIMHENDAFWKRIFERDFKQHKERIQQICGDTKWRVAFQRVQGSRVYIWGNTSNDRLGLPNVTAASITDPVNLKFFDNKCVVSLACAHETGSAAVTKNGTAYLWGRVPQSRSPIPIVAPSPIVKVCVGHQHIVALTTTGEVLTGGENLFKQLGHVIDTAVGGSGDSENGSGRFIVKHAKGLTETEGTCFVDICAPSFATVALTKNGRICTLGNDFQFSESANLQSSKITRIDCGYRILYGMTPDGDVWKLQPTPNLINFGGKKIIKQVSAASGHALALTAEGDELGLPELEQYAEPQRLTVADTAAMVTCGADYNSGGWSAVLSSGNNNEQLLLFGRFINGQITYPPVAYTSAHFEGRSLLAIQGGENFIYVIAV